MGQMGRDEDVRFLVAPSVLLYPILFLNIKHLKYFVLYFHPSPAFTRPDPAAWRKVIESRGSLERVSRDKPLFHNAQSPTSPAHPGNTPTSRRHGAEIASFVESHLLFRQLLRNGVDRVLIFVVSGSAWRG
jgi:hypothetical protein